MSASVRVLKAAGRRLDEIFLYTNATWGEDRAIGYIRGLFDTFEDIAARRVPWRQIPAEFGVDGFFCRHERHFIYWKVLANGDVGIVTVLHERMHQLERFRDDAP